MVSITLSVPEELKARMDSFSEMNWSAVARNAINKKIVLLEKFHEFTKDSELTEEDALKYGTKMSRNITRRLRRK